ncbi:MAG: 50S ribosomal protein L25 [Deltaproteobacteria bacterium]|jgi:large subunit ribosomal protein L25|nr:50S ribosomal protein L25 [Deltaproteobacteria bacterium]MBW2477628.1 50S ribosomal protein L25 [Deltaproteobacteria bacterium]MBW2504212.1 50S ribosomal protein L25 [Deltaproteobacteria bacterium]MBW2519580.1 50S ribosomal protein L25 [Deltaproteobacteria bacterium]
MAKSVLNVEPRLRSGKGGSRKVRAEGLVPAIVYGKGIDTLNLRIEPKALQKAISTDAGWNALITLKGNGPFDGKVVILKDMQIDPIRRNVLHVDFHAIDLKKKISVMVPVHVAGKSEGEKMGGSLQIVRHELEILCLPTDIPPSIEIDVSSLQIGDVVHIEDIVLPESTEAPHDVNFTVLTVVGLKAEVEEEPEEGVEAVEIGEEAEISEESGEE